MSEIGPIAALITAVAAIVAVVAGYVQFVLRRWLLPSVEFDVDYTPLCQDSGHEIGEVACRIKNTGSNIVVVTGVRCRMSYRCFGEGRWPIEAPPDPARLERLGRHEREPIEPAFPHPVEPMALESAWLLILHPPPSGASVATSPLSARAISAPVTPSATPGDTAVAAASLPTSVPSAPPASIPEGSADGHEVADPNYGRTFVQPGATQLYRKPIVLPIEAQLLHVWGAFDYRIQMSWASKWLVRVFNKPPPTLDWRNGVENHTVRRTFKVSSLGI